MKKSRVFVGLGLLLGACILILGYQNCQQGGAGLGGLRTLGSGGGGDGEPDPDYLEIQIGDGGLNPFPISDTANPINVNFSCVTAGLSNIRVTGTLTRGTATQSASASCSEDTGQGQISFPRPVNTAQNGSLTLTIRGEDDSGGQFTKTDTVPVRYQSVTTPPPPPPPARSLSVYNASANGLELRVEVIAKGYAPTDTYNLEAIWTDSGVQRSLTGLQIAFPQGREPRLVVGLPNFTPGSAGTWSRDISFTIRDIQRNLSDSIQYIAPRPTQEQAYYMAVVDQCSSSIGPLQINLAFQERRDANGNPASSATRTGTIQYRNISTNAAWQSVPYSGTPDGNAELVVSIPQTSPGLSNLASDTILLRVLPGTPITGPFYGAFFQGGSCGR